MNNSANRISPYLLARLARLKQIFYGYIKQVPLYQANYQPPPPPAQAAERLTDLVEEEEKTSGGGGGGTVKGFRQKTKIPKLTKNGKP